VTTLVTQHFGAPTSSRDARAQAFARSRAVDELAGRTVWCAAALPEGREQAERLQSSLSWTGADGVGTQSLRVSGEVPLREAAQQLDALLGGDAAGGWPGTAERDAYDDGSGSGETLLRGDVAADDVVVFCDPLTAALASAVRERGAHTMWHVRIADPEESAEAAEALRFMRDYTEGVDAYLVTWEEDTGRGVVAHEIGALMPSADVLAAKELLGSEEGDDLAWGCLLADVVHGDRWESVGGMVHARPVVAAR
jgi:hypothetical protein